jgi:hypothetical protein
MLETRPQLGTGQETSLICSVNPSACDAGVPPTAGKAGQGGKGGQGGQLVSGSGSVIAGALGVSGAAAAGAGGMSVMNGGSGGMMPAALELGKACSTDDQCMTGHCDGVCCAGGDCCVTLADCKTTKTNGIDLACNDPSTCQGMGGVVECTTEFRCVAKGGSANDTACDATTVANSCGSYLPVYCNGNADQSPPVCPTSCKSDLECDTNAHCDTKTCVLDVPNGNVCLKNLDCASGHCANNFCCDSGDCCGSGLINFCPANYSAPLTCNPATCQGSGSVATCVDSRCGTRMLEDDSVCTDGLQANACGPFADVVCRGGGTVQPLAPACATTCTNNAQCDADAYCRSGTCEKKLDDGETCSNNNNCASNFCGANKICCSDTGGQCCKQPTDCTDPKFSTTKCTNEATCSGTVNAPACRSGACVAQPSDNPAACSGVTNLCAPYVPATATCPTRCRTSCNANAQCAANFECLDGTCQPALPMGGTGGGGVGGLPP